MIMKASDLEYRIEIYRQVVARSASGAANISYEYRCSTRAHIRYASGSRTVENNEIFYDVDRQFVVRHYVPVEETDIIHWNNQRWRILSIDRNREWNDIIIQTTLINE